MELWQIIVVAVVGAYFTIGFLIQRFSGRFLCEGDCDDHHEEQAFHTVLSPRDRFLAMTVWLPAIIYYIGILDHGLPAVKRTVRWMILGT